MAARVVTIRDRVTPGRGSTTVDFTLPGRQRDRVVGARELLDQRVELVLADAGLRDRTADVGAAHRGDTRALALGDRLGEGEGEHAVHRPAIVHCRWQPVCGAQCSSVFNVLRHASSQRQRQ